MPRILFLCTGNSCRSQMAEGWARALKAGVVEPYSAGIAIHELDPRAVKAMAEVGIDISGHRPKHVNDLAEIRFDYVVTVCDHAREHCPVFSGGVKIVHVGFEDPPRLALEANSEREKMDIYRRVRDEIKEFVTGIPESLREGVVR
ncbi:arsenate reductase ArsC [bacterium]|nr:arsenate reductase ArsC [bacterium]